MGATCMKATQVQIKMNVRRLYGTGRESDVDFKGFYEWGL